MTEGVDYSFDPPDLAKLKAAGKSFVGRYLPTGSGKDLTHGEALDIQDAGLNLFLYYEDGTDFMLSASGATKAHNALNGAAACKVPVRMVYFACDTDVSVGQKVTVMNFLADAAKVLGKDRTGLYHGHVGDGLLAEAIAAGYAGAEANYTGDPPLAGMRLHQYQGTTALAGGDVDLVRALVADYGQCWFDGNGGDDVALTGNQEDALAADWGDQRRWKNGSGSRPKDGSYTGGDGKDRTASAQAGWDRADAIIKALGIK